MERPSFWVAGVIAIAGISIFLVTKLAHATAAGQNLNLRIETASAGESTIVSELGSSTFAVPSSTYYYGLVMTSSSYTTYAGTGSTYLQLQCSVNADNTNPNALINGTQVAFSSAGLSASTLADGSVLVYTSAYNNCASNYVYQSIDVYNSGSASDLACPSDNTAFSSNWEGYVSQGGNCMGAVADTTSSLVSFFSSGPTNLTLGTMSQYQSDGSTTLAEGGASATETVVFKGDLYASSSDNLKLNVEVEPFGTSFSGTPTATSTNAVMSGATASTTVSGLAHGWYHWKGRAIDTDNMTTTAWREFGTAGNVDFAITSSTTAVGQNEDLRTETASSGESTLVSELGNATIATPGSTDVYGMVMTGASYATYKGSSNTYLQLQCSTQPDNTNPNALINGTQVAFNSGSLSTSSLINGDVLVYTTTTNSGCGGSYNYISMDVYNSGSASGLACPSDNTAFSSNWEGYVSQSGNCMGGVADDANDLIDFMNTNLIPSFTLGSLEQYKSDATTTINEASTTTESGVVFGGVLSSTGTSSLQLQVEIATSGTSFTNVPTVTSTFVSPGTMATATYSLFPESSANGNYRWQARIKDQNGAISDWQTYGSSATNTIDFAINTVPLYTQISSNYPSLSNSTGTGWWSGITYADGNADCGATIGQCGCVLASTVMTLRYFGITSDENASDINPGNLNTWLNNNDGYDSNPTSTTYDSMYWGSIETYSQTSPSGTAQVAYEYSLSGGGSSSTFNSELVSLLDSPTSTPNPVILYEASVPGSHGGSVEHFITATGFAFDNQNRNTSTFTVRDPVWYATNLLSQIESNTTTMRDYANNYNGIHVYKPISGGGGGFAPGGLLPKNILMEYSVNLPAQLSVIDPSGRRLGNSFDSSMVYTEIPGDHYSKEGKLVLLSIENPISGVYKISIASPETQKYNLEVTMFDGHIPRRKLISGTIKAGQLLTFSQVYDFHQPLSGLSLTQVSTSTVASIVSNLEDISLPAFVPPPAPASYIQTSTSSRSTSTVISAK